MADLQMHALRDTIRGLRSDVEGLRRRASSGTMMSVAASVGTVNSDGIYALTAPNDTIRYTRMGDLVVVVPDRLQLGTITAAGTGGLRFSLPVTAASSSAPGPIGRALIRDASTGTETMVDVYQSGDWAVMYVTPASQVTPTSPFTWAGADYIAIGSLTYEAST